MLTYWLLGEKGGLQVPFVDEYELNDKIEKTNSNH